MTRSLIECAIEAASTVMQSRSRKLCTCRSSTTESGVHTLKRSGLTLYFMTEGMLHTSPIPCVIQSPV